MVHLKCPSTRYVFCTKSHYVLSRDMALCTHAGPICKSFWVAASPSAKAWPLCNVNIEPLSHAPVNVYHPLNNSGNIFCKAAGNSTPYVSEAADYVFAVVSILNDIILLVCTAVVDSLLAHFYAQDFSLHLFYRHV